LQETVAGLSPFQKAGLDPREQLDAFFEEYLRTIVPPVGGRLASLSVRDAAGVGGGACSVRVRDWDTDWPAALVAVKVNVHCRPDVVAGTGDS
jgi:hypothetical protein